MPLKQVLYESGKGPATPTLSHRLHRLTTVCHGDGALAEIAVVGNPTKRWFSNYAWLSPIAGSTLVEPIDDDPGAYRQYARCREEGIEAASKWQQPDFIR